MLVVCDHCLQAIESHEGKQIPGPIINPKIHYGYFDDDGEFHDSEAKSDGNEYIECDWCHDFFEEYELTAI